MNNKLITAAGVAVIVIIVAGAFVLLRKDKQEPEAMLISPTPTIAEAEPDQQVSPTVTAVTATNTQQAGSYVDYNEQLLANANGGDVVLFFHASWCPTCFVLNKELQENPETIDSGLTILRVDYDSSSALKQKYGITYQHTLVQVDSQGNLLKKWSGSYSAEEIEEQII